MAADGAMVGPAMVTFCLNLFQAILCFPYDYSYKSLHVVYIIYIFPFRNMCVFVFLLSFFYIKVP